ncbi:hypothetical protein K0M31_018266 [Melipona bicolor]|uniref:Uncharacterized protein n=1 Tax=Melipona bicolor TaxID=60889 RepID=A0AA40KDQ3_9HYME|nr:hypothetical protein K0M31_018266 [Melipona bicolor]
MLVVVSHPTDNVTLFPSNPTNRWNNPSITVRSNPPPSLGQAHSSDSLGTPDPKSRLDKCQVGVPS